MWIVDTTTECKKRFRDDFKKGLFSKDDGIAIQTWVTEMEKFGPSYIETAKKWDDHPLFDQWKGYRASCFSSTGRIIYREVKGCIEVKVVRITPDHDYKGDENG